MPFARPSLRRSALAHHLAPLAAAVGTLLVAACGGSDNDNAAPAQPPAAAIAPSAEFAGKLVNTAPGAGAQESDWDAASCSDQRQKRWVRSVLNENYLFYKEAPLARIDPDAYSGTVPELFYDYTSRALPDKDRFSFVTTQASADARLQTGTAIDLGLDVGIDSGKRLRVLFVQPNSPAAAAGLGRGAVIDTIGGQAVAALSAEQITGALDVGSGATVSLGVRSPAAGNAATVSLTSTSYAVSPLLSTSVLAGAAGGSRVGYIAFTSFAAPVGELQLADAFASFATQSITDLVVDLRYNTGGSLRMASQLAYLVAGQAQTQGKVFEALTLNDKRTAQNESAPFIDKITDEADRARAGEALRAVNLRRVFVLVSSSTCSASEVFISALRGIDVQTVLIGTTTCGKPYSFSQTNNCGLAYFALEAEGRNQKGEPVPLTGITPTCAAADGLDRELGDPQESLLATALSYAQTGTCPANASQSAALGDGNHTLAFANRLQTAGVRKARR